MLGIGSGIQPRGDQPVDRRRRIADAPLGSAASIGATRRHATGQGDHAGSAANTGTRGAH